jgi:hypothetical protein
LKSLHKVQKADGLQVDADANASVFNVARVWALLIGFVEMEHMRGGFGVV